RRRRSEELLGRRMISGATLLPVSRRARRPLSQSAQLIGSCIGIVGTPDLESFGFFIDETFHVEPIRVRKAPHLVAVYFTSCCSAAARSFLAHSSAGGKSWMRATGMLLDNGCASAPFFPPVAKN